MPSVYDHQAAVAAAVGRGEHRDLVGGLWDDIGQLQISFLREHGLVPGMLLLDVGCGCFRGGVPLVRFLDPGDYFGVDINPALIEAGYRDEIGPAGLGHKLPRDNVVCASDFGLNAFPGVQFDVALAHSLFTHLTLNRIRLCLAHVMPRVKPGGSFYATYFECPPGKRWDDEITHSPGGVRTYPDADPYHYRFEDLEYLAHPFVHTVEGVSDWAHPRGQKMARFAAP